jgi:hypothetical protein
LTRINKIKRIKMKFKNRFGILGIALVSLLISLCFVSAAISFRSMLLSWDANGVFDYLLPFLLVFALVFGILQKVTILGDNKGVHAIIAAALGLMALWTGFFQDFLKVFSTNLAIGISVLLGAIILLGLFYDSEHKWIMNVLFAIGALAFILIVSGTFSGGMPGYGGNLWDEYGPALVTILILAGIIWAIVAGGGSGGKRPGG